MHMKSFENSHHFEIPTKRSIVARREVTHVISYLVFSISTIELWLPGMIYIDLLLNYQLYFKL